MKIVMPYFISIGVPLIIFLGIQVLRAFKGIWRSGGADIIGVFVVLDITIIYTTSSFKSLVRTIDLQSDLHSAAIIALVVGGFILLPTAIFYGENKLQEADKKRAQGDENVQYPKWPFVVIWGITTSFMAAHLLYFLGDWT